MTINQNLNCLNKEKKFTFDKDKTVRTKNILTRIKNIIKDMKNTINMVNMKDMINMIDMIITKEITITDLEKKEDMVTKDHRLQKVKITDEEEKGKVKRNITKNITEMIVTVQNTKDHIINET